MKNTDELFQCQKCPAFYEVKEEGLSAAAGGWQKRLIRGKQVLCCLPARRFGAKRTMDRFCYYCLARTTGKKIGHKASWTGRTPTWCPVKGDAE